MKNILKTTIFGLMALVFASCQEEELRTHFPISMPVFDNASVAENAIVYGDSISLSVDISDPLTPLSTLEIKVVVGDEIVFAERIRTKGNSASYAQKYWIPFVAHMPHKAEVEVHLSAVNIEGTKKDTILLKTIASRPEIPTVYMITPTATVEMKLTDAANYIYTADNLSLTNDVSFRIVTKINAFKKTDWANPANLVFGLINGQLGVVDVTINGNIISVTGDMIRLYDPALVGFKKVTLDLFNFTVKGDGDKLTPATSMSISTFGTVQLTSIDHMNVATKEDWKTKVMYLGEGTEMEITGLTAVENSMDPTFFKYVGGNKVQFLGKTGIYTLYYLPRLQFVFVEQPTAVYPDALWLVGVGTGPARLPGIKTSSWNWNSPLEYHFCRKVSEGIYEVVFFANHEIDLTANEPWRLTFSMKFMHQRNWGVEESSNNYALPSNGYLFSPSPNDVGNFSGTAEFGNLPGIYQFTLNMNTKTSTLVKIK